MTAGLLPADQLNPPLRVPQGVEVGAGVAYARYGSRDLVADLFLARQRPAPAVVYAFGGGWRQGSRAHFYRQAAHLAGRGVAGMCIDYRLSQEATYPGAVHDCKAAVRYLRAHADELGIDPGRIGAAGGSAGGHLAAMLATTAGDQSLEGEGGHAERSSEVQLAVLFNPGTDLRVRPEEVTAGVIRDFLGGTPEQAPERYDAASPILRVSAATPPCLVLHGTEDRAIPIQASERFVEKVNASGGRATLLRYQGAPHGFFNGPRFFQTTLDEVTRFVCREFGASPSYQRRPRVK